MRIGTPLIGIAFCLAAVAVSVVLFRRISNPAYRDLANTDYLDVYKRQRMDGPRVRLDWHLHGGLPGFLGAQAGPGSRQDEQHFAEDQMCIRDRLFQISENLLLGCFNLDRQDLLFLPTVQCKNTVSCKF